MLIYEVNIAADADIADRYGVWLETHIREMIAIPGFEGADCYTRRPEDEEGAAGKKLWTVHYRLTDRQALVNYLTRRAPAMRQEALDRFGDKFSATRRVLEPVRR